MILKIQKFKRNAFTLLEMVIVIVVMGIMASIGTEALLSSYENYIFTSVNSRLQSQSESAVNQIANRLQYRIKDSVIKRDTAGNFYPVASADAATILEWIGVDREGWLGTTNQPLWSGFIDLDAVEDSKSLYPNKASTTRLISPGTDTSTLSSLISNLSNSGSSITDSAIYFIGSTTDIETDYGWDGTAISDQETAAMHPIKNGAQINELIPSVDDFSDTKIFEYYQLSWTAYALVHNVAAKTLTLHYDYQPWNGEKYSTGKSALLMRNVTAFNFKSAGDILKVQICVSENDLTAEGEYAICKEKTIF
jgi:prepilin-type N-terminal cleavage/methylation domain-containing protein